MHKTNWAPEVELSEEWLNCANHHRRMNMLLGKYGIVQLYLLCGTIARTHQRERDNCVNVCWTEDGSDWCHCRCRGL